MNNRTVKPALPEQFYRKGGWGAAGLVAVMLLYFIGGGLANTYIWLHSDWPLSMRVLLSLPAFFIAGQGMHLMGWIGHDGLHFNLSKNRHVSTVLGIVFSAMSVLFIEMGMVLDHWTHHRYTNLPQDPDLKLFVKHRRFLPRMLFTRLRCNRLYLRRSLRLALGMPLDRDLTRIVFPFSLATLRAYAWLNLACVALWGALYLAIAWRVDWRIGVIGFVIPAAVANILSGLRSYIEHNGTGITEMRNTRTRAARFWTIMEVGGNFHLEHHLYPGVPQWKLPGVHRHLKALGCYDQHCHIDHSILGNYRYASSDYVYPDGSGTPSPGAREALMY